MPLPGSRLTALGIQPFGGTNWNAPQNIATFAALRALSVAGLADTASVNVQGGAAFNDGKQGNFRYSSISVVADDNQDVIQPAVGAGRWLRNKTDAAQIAPEGVAKTQIKREFRTLMVPTVADLEAMTFADSFTNERVHVLGYYAPGDGGGQYVYIDKADVATARNGVKVFVAADGTRLKSTNELTSALKQGGAKGDGITDDTARIVAVFAAYATGDKITTGAGNFKLTSKVDITSKNLSVDATGARFTLVGDNTGFNIRGIITSFDWVGGWFLGDGVNRDADSTKIQVGILVGNNAGDTISNVSIFGVRAKDTNNGIKVTNGTTPSPGLTKSVTLSHCYAENQIGAVGGTGYGFISAGAYDSRFSNCTADGAKRHGIYFSGGKGGQIVDCTVRNCGTATLIRGAIAISRTADVTVSGCTVKDNVDIGMYIDQDGQGAAPDNVCRRIKVSGCVFDNNAVGDISIGTTTPETAGVPEDINVSDCVLRGTSNAYAVRIYAAKGVRLNNITSNYSTGTGGSHFALYGTGGSAYTDDVAITKCTFIGMTWGVEIPAVIATGASKVVVENNTYSTVAPFNIIGGSASQTNVNMILRRSFVEVRDSADGDTTPCVAGVDTLIVANSALTTITNLDGGREGQRVTLWFFNGNTTISNALFHIPATYTPAADSTLTLILANGSWRKCT